MDKSSDSSSDSDSSSSTSWVFVDDTSTSTPSPKAANTFHLDCSREPIQELTEQDLLSAGSDFESDTDGISVISESEVPVEDPCPNLQTSCSSNDDTGVVGKADIPDDDASDGNNTTEKKALLVKDQNERLTKIIKPLHVLGVGFILTAVLFACYSRLTTKIKENVDFDSVEDVPFYDKIKVEDGTSYNKIDDVASCDVYNAKTDFNKDLEEIVDITMTCAFHHKPKSDVVDKKIKKCVKKGYNTKKTENSNNPESIYSETLESVEHYKKVIDIKAKDTVPSNNKPEIRIPDDDFAEHIRRKFSREIEEKNYKKNDDTFCNIKREKRESYKNRETVGGREEEFAKSKHKENVIKLRAPKKKQEQFKNGNKRNFEIHERSSKDQIPTKKPYKYQKDKRHSDHKDKRQDYKDKKHDHNDNKYNYVDKKKYEHKHSYNKKHQKNVVVTISSKDENKENRFKEVPSKYSKSKEYKYKDKIMMRKRNNGTTGEWYTNLHKARNQLRKQEHVSDWVFDRAHIRNKKRNKAQWYFKWMNIREQLRYKQSYKPYSS